MDEKLKEFWVWMNAQLASESANDPGYFAGISDVIDYFEEWVDNG